MMGQANGIIILLNIKFYELQDIKFREKSWQWDRIMSLQMFVHLSFLPPPCLPSSISFSVSLSIRASK